MKSDGAVVRTSKGTPPAALIASLTTRATPSRCAKQTASSEEEFTTAIFGFAMSASDSPSARQCERRMEELAARLRKVVMVRLRIRAKRWQVHGRRRPARDCEPRLQCRARKHTE